MSIINALNGSKMRYRELMTTDKKSYKMLRKIYDCLKRLNLLRNNIINIPKPQRIMSIALLNILGLLN